VQDGTANYALYIDAQGLYNGAVVDLYDPDITGDVYNIDGTLNIYGGNIDGDVCDGGGCTINLYNLPRITGSVTGGTINGYWIDGDGIIHPGVAWPSPNIVNRWDISTGKVVEETDLATAVSNAADGDTIALGDGTHTLASKLTITKELNFVGSGRENVTISGSFAGDLIEFGMTSFEEVSFQNLGFEIDNAGNVVAISGEAASGGTVTFNNCRIKARSTGGTADAVNSSDDDIVLINCEVEAFPDTSGYNINCGASGVVTLFQGTYFNSDDTILNCDAGGEIYLIAPRFNVADADIGDIQNGAGDIYGEYQDANGVTRYVGDDSPAADQFPKWDDTNDRWVPGYVDELWESDAGAVAWSVDAGGDLDGEQGNDITLQGASGGPQSGTRRNLLDGIGHILDGGHPTNPYPATRDSDDAEFNNSEQAENNTIGTHAGGDFWEWSPGAPSIGTINSNLANHFYVQKIAGDSGTDRYLAGDITALGEDDSGRYEVFVTMLPNTNKTGNILSIKLIDTTSGYYIRLQLDDSAANGLQVVATYDVGGGETTDTTVIIGHPITAATISLRRFESGGNAYGRWLFALPGLPSSSHFPPGGYLSQRNLTAKANFAPDEFRIEFSNVSIFLVQIDSFRKTL